MSRLPYNILVVPYTRIASAVHYCIFKRSDMNIWQFVAGGGEDLETPDSAAKRELFEETGILTDNLLQLEARGFVPAYHFPKEAQDAWGEKVTAIPVYCFAVETGNLVIQLSDEHTEYRWVDFDTAIKHLYFDLDKSAVNEINQHLHRLS